ncbi:hypothetical protein JOD43_001339 [Pullulanibacillus pueri]|uniref:Transposase DDE domain-containing protein n=1 Tax=Pullulanibacillus pueri TaxID=1437324 RepID=A0A8J2ZU10_9BACL|nr:transposase [Pullulanibacillus pueri]MBM7681172.1 hypothetical protein [Pullulanibacillus pueri]GGH77329.1 hypothetical protein GCM10007096_09070 [Pullulanibacillus pueri]
MTYSQNLIDVIEKEEVLLHYPKVKEKSRERYKIEAKNSELKNRHGYNVYKSSGLLDMEIQGAMAIFAVNLKRILKLMK